MNFSEIFFGLCTKLRDICFPATCCKCGKYTENQGLCGNCWSKIHWISEPICPICGKPFEIDIGISCAECRRKKPSFDCARAVFEYDDESKPLILKFKHSDATFLGEQLAQWMYRVGESLFEKADLIVPVPIHFFKRLKRKYNQTEILANYLAQLSGKTYEPRILKKNKPSRSQEGLTKIQRKENVKNSFAIDEKYAPLLNEKSVLLIDDVLTTGATVNECAKILKKHGAKSVFVLTLARVSI